MIACSFGSEVVTPERCDGLAPSWTGTLPVCLFERVACVSATGMLNHAESGAAQSGLRPDVIEWRRLRLKDWHVVLVSNSMSVSRVFGRGYMDGLALCLHARCGSVT